MFHIVKRTAVVARALFILLYRLIMILWNAGRVGRLAVVIGGLVAFWLLLALVVPVPAATQTAVMPAPISETAPTAIVEPTPVVVEPVSTELPRAIVEMAAPEVVTPTEAPAEGSAPAADVSAPPEAAPAPPVVDAPVATSDESAPCAPGQYKGNRNSHIFHAPGQLAYARTHANVTCFDSAAQATAAGYRAAKR